MTDTFNVKLNGVEQSTNLEELLNLDLSSFKADVGDFWRVPRGKYRFTVKNAKLEMMGDSPAAILELEIAHCFGIISDDETPESTHGKTARFPYFLNDMEKGIGQLKWLMEASGATIAGGNLKTQLDSFCGSVFDANVKHDKNKNDPDKPYVKIDLKSVTAPAV